MSSEKRKAADDWIEAMVIEENRGRGVYLATFSGVIPPKTATFREYKRKREDYGRAKDIILQGETERIEFEGRTKQKDGGDSCQYTPFFLVTANIGMLSVFLIKKRERLNYCQRP
jgi:hypothetical protein